MRISDWSSDVCSSDLIALAAELVRRTREDAVDAVEIVARAEVVGGNQGGAGHLGPNADMTLDDAFLRRRHRTILPATAESTQRSIVASRSEEHTSELQSLMRISYAVFCLKKKKNYNTQSKQN